jgi:hypothetical protein
MIERESEFNFAYSEAKSRMSNRESQNFAYCEAKPQGMNRRKRGIQ